MLTDSDVRRLAEELAGGALTAAMPLLDRLEELGDPRRHDLLKLVGDLLSNLLPRQRPTWRGTAESAVAFDNCVRRLFWPEFLDKPLADALRAGEEALREPPAQIGQLGHAQSSWSPPPFYGPPPLEAARLQSIQAGVLDEQSDVTDEEWAELAGRLLGGHAPATTPKPAD